MSPALKQGNSLTRWYYAVSVVVGIFTVCYLNWDHLFPKSAVPATSISYRNQGQVGSAVQGNNFSGTNIVGNNGTVNINPSQIPPLSSKEAARQRMNASGIQDNEDRYYSALQNHELDVLRMFNEVGRTLNPNDFKFFVNLLYDPDVAKLLMQVDQSPGCPTDPGSGNFYTQVNEPALEFVKKVCSKDAVRNKLKQQIAGEQHVAAVAAEDDRENEANRQGQIARCEQTLIRNLGPLISQASAHQHCIMQIIPTEAQQPSVTHTASSLEKALAILGGK